MFERGFRPDAGAAALGSAVENDAEIRFKKAPQNSNSTYSVLETAFQLPLVCVISYARLSCS
ncbi:hypothetical protein GCM10011375_02560 [Hymenobacter qilianensis]|uniref:Uncharacterized protein n=1 Tax=Hymenobacter qilianensis TaxID=1385715 RepID=A0ACB5PLK1_9BACT|nr:hypothetical protein GCM10011375_02560 [Hymenobacter qilianensis]